ncbi:MAG: sensor histidine kinase, partial [Chloroflexi bacterium]|nr:sensor histidine kinase [Chloroflexota bacterium]
VVILRLQPEAEQLQALAEIGWTINEVNVLQAEVIMFMMVPVVLASWQYGRRGTRLSVAWAALLYLLATPFMSPATLALPAYLLAGAVRIGLLGLVGFIVQALVSLQRREHQALEAAHRKLAEQQAAMERLAVSQERNRLARELHDTLAHSLSGAAVQLQAVGTLLKVDPAAAASELAEAQREIRHGLEEARRSIGALRASPLEDLGLAEALRQRVGSLGERAGLRTTCTIGELPAVLPPLVEQTIYRTTEEALLNAEKYAQASELHLSLANGADGLTLIIRDDGAGFDVASAPRPGRFGLAGLQERADLIGAKLTIASRPGEGTVVVLLCGYVGV